MIGNLYSNINLSQEEKVLLHLLKYGKINSKVCNEIYGFRHLPSVIRYLKKRSINIECEQKNGYDCLGSNTYWVDYTLAPVEKQPIQVVKMINNLKYQYGII